MFSVTSIVGT